MRYPWANIALVFLFGVELVTGYLGLTHSNPEWIAAMHIHRITGFSILALFIWKSRNILGSFRTRSNWKASLETMLASSVLLVGLLVVLGLGLAWSHFGPYSFLGFSGTTIHLNLALFLIPLLVWHSFRHKISFRKRYVAGRRNFLRFAGLAVGGLALWQLTDRLNILAGGPVADRRFTGSHPENGPDFPVTMWLNDRTPWVDEQEWRLQVNGHVEKTLRNGLRGIAGVAVLDHRHPGLHRRLVHDAGVGRDRGSRSAGPGETPARCGQHHHTVADGILPPVFDGRVREGSAREPGGRRAAIAGARLPGAHGGATQAWLRLGEVGGRDHCERHQQVLAAALAADVKRWALQAGESGGYQSVQRGTSRTWTFLFSASSSSPG